MVVYAFLLITSFYCPSLTTHSSSDFFYPIDLLVAYPLNEHKPQLLVLTKT